MHYITVYDAAARQISTISWCVIPSFILTLVAWNFVHRPWRLDKVWPSLAEKIRQRPPFVTVCYWFALVWTITSFSSLFLQYLNIVVQRDNYAQIAEGPVTHFLSTQSQGHAEDGFDVQGQHFTYATSENIVAFNQPAVKSGTIHEGLNVRISYSGNTILKLEIAP